MALVTLRSTLGQLIQQTPLLFFSCSATLGWSNTDLPHRGQVWLLVWTLILPFLWAHQRTTQPEDLHNLRWIVVEECEIVRGRHRNRLATPWTPFLRFSVARSGMTLHHYMLSHSLAKWDMKLTLLEPVYRSPFYLPYFVLFPLHRANLALLSHSPSAVPIRSFPLSSPLVCP